VKCAKEVVCKMLPIVTCILTQFTQFREWYSELCGDLDAQQSMQTKPNKGMRALLRELSDDEDETTNNCPDVPEDPNWPWLRHFHIFVDTVEQVPDGWSAVKWWGVSVPTLKLNIPVTLLIQFPG